uniref:Uncharacterized protein n=1 Tax=Arundo donax TaxID=35708 RepID=A0A0A8XZJ6_ARUDO
MSASQDDCFETFLVLVLLSSCNQNQLIHSFPHISNFHSNMICTHGINIVFFPYTSWHAQETG